MEVGSLFNFFQGSGFLLFILLVLVLVLAFKILKLFFETLLVAILSGVFYVVLAQTGAPLDVNAANVLLFSFLGSILFLVYSMIRPVVSMVWKALAGVFGLVQGVGRKIKLSEAKKGGEKKKRDIILKEVHAEDDD